MANREFIQTISTPKNNYIWFMLGIALSLILGVSLWIIPAYWIAAIFLLVGLVGYLCLHPDKFFYLAIFTIPFTDRVRVLPISFSLNEIIILSACFVCLIQSLFQERQVNLKTKLDYWNIILALMFLAAGWFSASDTGMLGFFKIFEAFIVYYMTIYLIRTRQVSRSSILKVLVVTALFQSLLGTFQSITGIGADFQSNRGYLGYLGLGSNIVWHGRGTTWHFNTLGNYLATNFVLFIPIYLFVLKRKKIGLFIAFGLLLGIITTYSRGSLLGLSAGALYILVWSQPNWKRTLGWGTLFFVFVYPIVNFLSNSEYVSTVSYNDRLFIWQVPIAAITSSAKAFWLGSGLNSYGAVAWPYIPAWVPLDQYRNWFAHNFYLLTMVEIGLLGTLILFYFLGFICVKGVQQFKQCTGFTRTYGLSISAAMITIFFVSIFDHTFAAPHFKVFIFLLLGLMYAKRTNLINI